MKRDLSMDSFDNLELIEEEHLMQDSFKFSQSDSSCKSPFWDLFNITESGPHLSNNNNNNNMDNDAHMWSDELLNSIVAPEMVISEDLDSFSDEKVSNSEKLRGDLVIEEERNCISQNLGGEIVINGDSNRSIVCNSEKLGVEMVIKEGEDHQLGKMECNFEHLEGENENVTEQNDQSDERGTQAEEIIDNPQISVHEILIERETEEEREIRERNAEEEERTSVSLTKTQTNESTLSFPLMETEGCVKNHLSFPLMEKGGERVKLESLEREFAPACSEMESGCVLQDPCPLSESSPETQLTNPKLVVAERSVEESPMDVADCDSVKNSVSTINETTVDSDSNENEAGKSNIEETLMDKNNIFIQNEFEKENITPSENNSGEDIVQCDSNLSFESINQLAVVPLKDKSNGEENDKNTTEKNEIADVTMEDIGAIQSEHEIIEDVTICMGKSDEVSEKIPEKCEEKVSEKIPEKCEEEVSDKIHEQFEITNDTSKEEVSEKIPEKSEEVSDETLEESEIIKNDASKEEIGRELCPDKNSSEPNVGTSPIRTSPIGTLIQSEQEIEDGTFYVDPMVVKSLDGENYKSTPEITEVKNDVTMQDVSSPIKIHCEANFGTGTLVPVDPLVEKSSEEENDKNAHEPFLTVNDAEVEKMNSPVKITETCVDIVEVLEEKSSRDKNDENTPEKSLIVNDTEMVEMESEFSPVEINFVVDLSIEKSNGETNAERSIKEVEITNATEAAVLNSVDDSPDEKSNEEESSKNAPEISDFTKDASREVEPETPQLDSSPVDSLIQSDTNVMQISGKTLQISEEAPEISDFTNVKIVEGEIYEKTHDVSGFVSKEASEEKDCKEAPKVSGFTKETTSGEQAPEESFTNENIGEEKHYEKAPTVSDFTDENSGEVKGYKKAPEESDFTDELLSEEKDYEKAPAVSDFADENIGEEKDYEKATELSDFTDEMISEEKNSEKAPVVSDFTNENIGEENYEKAPAVSDSTDEMISEEKDSEKLSEVSCLMNENMFEEKDNEKVPELSDFTDKMISEEKNSKIVPELTGFTKEKICEEIICEEAPQLSGFRNENICEEKVCEAVLKVSDISTGKKSEEKNSEYPHEVSDFGKERTEEERNYEKAPEILEFMNNPSKEVLSELFPMKVNVKPSQINVDTSVKKNSEENDSKNTLGENNVQDDVDQINDETISGNSLVEKCSEEQNAENTLENLETTVDISKEEELAPPKEVKEKMEITGDISKEEELAPPIENKEKMEITDDISKEEELAPLNEIKEKMEDTLEKVEIRVGTSNKETKSNLMNETKSNLMNETPILHSELEIKINDEINDCTEKLEDKIVGASIEEGSRSSVDRCQATIGPLENVLGPNIEQLTHEKSDCKNDINGTSKEPETKFALEELKERYDGNFPKCPSSTSQVEPLDEIAKDGPCKGKNVILPDLNASVPPSKFFTEAQKTQLRAQIFVYGALVDGTLPKEAHMVNSFGESERNTWIGLWSAYFETLKKRNIATYSCDTPRPSASRLSTESMRNSPIQNDKLFLSSNLHKSPLSSARFDTGNPKRKRKHSISNKNSPDSATTNKIAPGVNLQNLPGQLSSTLFWGPKPNIPKVTANQLVPGGYVENINSLISLEKHKRENYQIAPAQMYSTQASPRFISNQIAPSGSLKIHNVKQEASVSVPLKPISHLQSPQTNYQNTPPVLAKLSAEQLKIQEALISAENIAKQAAQIARLASQAALNAKILADEAISTLTGHKPDPFQDMLTPLKGKNNNNNNNENTNNNNVSEIVSGMKEASRIRVQKAVTASKQAENLDGILRTAELAVGAVQEAGRAVLMGDPLPFCMADLVQKWTGDLQLKGELKGKESVSPVQLDFGSKDEGNGKDGSSENGEERGIKKGSLVEMKGQKGGWFEATVLSIKDGMAKIQYTHTSHEGVWVPIEVKNGEAPLLRIVSMNLKNGGKRKRYKNFIGSSWCIGDRVDAWMENAWWEGIITGKEDNEAKYTVHFPEAEGQSLVFDFWNLRPSLIWKDDNWIEWVPLIRKNNQFSEGDSPIGKRRKVGPPIKQDTKTIPKPKIVTRNTKNVVPVKKHTKERSFVTGTKTKEREAITEPEQKRVKTCFGIPKPNKRTKFLEVDQVTRTSQNPKPTFGKDSTQNFNLKNYVKPQNPKPKSAKDLAPNLNLKNDPKAQNPKPKLTKDMAPNLSLKNAEKGKRPVIERAVNKRPISAPKGQNGNLVKKNLASNLEGRDGNSNKFGGVNVNVGETSGLRRSSRKVKPTSKLLEGLESSSLMSKAPHVGPTKGPISKKGRSSR